MLPASRDLECTLDGGGGDTHPVGECALTDLDRHSYHLARCPFSFGSHLRLPERTTTTRSGVSVHAFFNRQVMSDPFLADIPKGPEKFEEDSSVSP